MKSVMPVMTVLEWNLMTESKGERQTEGEVGLVGVLSWPMILCVLLVLGRVSRGWAFDCSRLFSWLSIAADEIWESEEVTCRWEEEDWRQKADAGGRDCRISKTQGCIRQQPNVDNQQKEEVEDWLDLIRCCSARDRGASAAKEAASSQELIVSGLCRNQHLSNSEFNKEPFSILLLTFYKWRQLALYYSSSVLHLRKSLVEIALLVRSYILLCSARARFCFSGQNCWCTEPVLIG